MSQPVISQTSSPKSSAYLEETSKNGVISLGSDMSEATLVQKCGPPASLTLPGENLGLDSGPGENMADDGEIDVFDATKYYKEGLNSSPEVGKTSEGFHDLNQGNDHREVYATKQLSPMAAMSVCSGSSSNSRGWLLHTRKTDKRKILAAICCNISCADKNSVAENSSKRSEESVLHQASKACEYREEPVIKMNSYRYSSFPLLSPNIGNQTEAGAIKTAQLKHWSSMLENGRSNPKERSAFPLKERHEIRNHPIPTETHDESDSSSDLFEIASLSKEILLNLQRESDGFSGGVTPSNHYPPSEVSIDWSVGTASVTEFSVGSNSDKLESSADRHPPRPVLKTNSETPKLRPRILSGCNSQKAVGVIGDAHRAYDLRNSEGRKQQIKPQLFTPRRE